MDCAGFNGDGDEAIDSTPDRFESCREARDRGFNSVRPVTEMDPQQVDDARGPRNRSEGSA